MKIISIVLVGFSIICSSCASRNEGRYDVLKDKLLEISPDILNAKSIIVIPREGCGGCIQNATHYVKNKIDSIESIVIFTGVGDKKLLKLQLGDKVLSFKNKCFVDTGNILMASQLTSTYPVIITLEKSDIKSIENFSPIL